MFSIGGPRQVEFREGVGNTVLPGLGRSISNHHFPGLGEGLDLLFRVFGRVGAGGDVGLGGMAMLL